MVERVVVRGRPGARPAELADLDDDLRRARAGAGDLEQRLGGAGGEEPSSAASSCVGIGSTGSACTASTAAYGSSSTPSSSSGAAVRMPSSHMAPERASPVHR